MGSKKNERVARSLPIDQLLQVDEVDPPDGALRDCLGDAFLLRRNVVVRNVRASTIAIGCELSTTPPYDYDGLPLLALPAILRSRVIGYHANAISARRLVVARPGRFTIDDVLVLGLRKNAVTHESAHCIADRLLPSVHAGNTRQYVLATQLAESCANASELVGSAFADDPMHVALYRINSFLPGSPAIRASLATLLDELGLAETVEVVVLGYLASNFLWRGANRAAIERLLSVAFDPSTFRKRTRRAARHLIREACALSPVFRARTTALHYRNVGIGESIYSLLDFDFIEVLESEPQMTRALHTFAGIVAHGPGALAATAAAENSKSLGRCEALLSFRGAVGDRTPDL
jgi:hypothetical protein